MNSKIVLILKPVVIRAGSLYDRFQGYLPGFVPRDIISRDTLGMGHTTPTATSVRKTQQISMLLRSTLMFLQPSYDTRLSEVTEDCCTPKNTIK